MKPELRKGIITAVGFIIEFLVWGSFYNFAVFYSSIVTYFNSSYGFIGFCATTMSSLGLIISPLAAEMVIHTSYGVSMFAMALFYIAAYFFSSLDTAAWEFFFSYGVLLGCCCALNAVVFNYLVDNMDGDHDSAISVMTSAAGLGAIFFGCMSAYFLMNTNIDWQTAFQYIALTGVVLIAGALVLAFLDKSQHRVPFVGIPEISCAPIGLFGHDEDLNSSGGAMSGGSDTELTRTLSLSESSPLLSGQTPAGPLEECCAVHLSDAEVGAAQLSGWELFLSSDRRPTLLGITHGLMIFTVATPIKLSTTYGLEVSYTLNGSYDYNVYYYMTISVGLGICLSRVMIVALQKLKGNGFGGLVQSKIIQIGTVAVMGVLACIPLSSMSIAGACVGMALYCFFAGGKIDPYFDCCCPFKFVITCSVHYDLCNSNY